MMTKRDSLASLSGETAKMTIQTLISILGALYVYCLWSRCDPAEVHLKSTETEKEKALSVMHLEITKSCNQNTNRY